MTPQEFVRRGPQSPDDLIGKAHHVAKVYYARAKSGDIEPMRLLFYGQPGTGKSAACRIIANALVDHSTSIRHISAKQITVDNIREWMKDFHYHTDQWRVYWIEEVDAVNNDVEVLMLQFLDEMPVKSAVLATSNEQMSGISNRFQSRMQAFRFQRPDVEEVEKLLLNKWPELGIISKEIAEANNGDVRASLNDAQSHVDVLRYQKKEKKHE